tara:strand:+ start:5200 stop:6489 length:1290 start_codon:yes stop_codon:yes gene_type:complete
VLEKFFSLKDNNTTIKNELVAGITTFITMAYIIFVNPQLMSSTGMDWGASFVGTCLAAAFACFVMGLYANWPVGLAPGMGLNAFFTYTVVGEMGYTWEVALGAVFIAGVLFVIMSITPLRQWMLNSIPFNLRIAMGAGVGLFIGMIGLRNGGIITSNEVTLLSMGNLANLETLLAVIGFIVISVLSIRKIPGSIVIGIFLVTLLAMMLGLVQYNGIVSEPPSLLPVLLKLDIKGAFDLAMISIIMSFLFVNLFDTAGTLLGVANQANLIDANGNIHKLDKALKADSSSSVVGSLFGCAPVTSYVESSAGVESGGRTGLTAVIVGTLFLIVIFFAPLAKMIPLYATAGALIYVSILMLSSMEKLNWSNLSDLLPALVIIVMIPLTFSIANGIALGFMSYVVIKLFTGQVTTISSGAWFLTVIFLSRFVFL